MKNMDYLYLNCKCEELKCVFSSNKSFYGKAKVEVEENKHFYKKTLLSYNTQVAIILEDKTIPNTIYCISPIKYSRTTTRHQKEFFKQNGLNENEIELLFINKHLVK